MDKEGKIEKEPFRGRIIPEEDSSKPAGLSKEEAVRKADEILKRRELAPRAKRSENADSFEVKKPKSPWKPVVQL